MNKVLWMILPPLLLAGCNQAETPAEQNLVAANESDLGNAMGPAMEPVAAPATDTPAYLAKASAGDLFEIESSRAIMAKTGNAGIKAFAQMMVEAHGQSTQKVKTAAQAAKLSVGAPALDSAQQDTLATIKSASGVAAEKVYLDAQRKAHDEALALHRAYADGGEVPELKTAAGEIVPVVQHHIDELAKLGTD